MNYTVCGRQLLFVEDDEKLKKEMIAYFFPRQYRFHGVRCGRSDQSFNENGEFRCRCPGSDSQKQHGDKPLQNVPRSAARDYPVFPGRRRQNPDRAHLGRDGLCGKTLFHAAFGNAYCPATAS